MPRHLLPFSLAKQGTHIIRVLDSHIKQAGVLPICRAVMCYGRFIEMACAIELMKIEVPPLGRISIGSQDEIRIKISVFLLCVHVIGDPFFQLVADILLPVDDLLVPHGVDLQGIAHGFQHLMDVRIHIKRALERIVFFPAVHLGGIDDIGDATRRLFYISYPGGDNLADELLLAGCPKIIRNFYVGEIHRFGGFLRLCVCRHGGKCRRHAGKQNSCTQQARCQFLFHKILLFTCSLKSSGYKRLDASSPLIFSLTPIIIIKKQLVFIKNK